MNGESIKLYENIENNTIGLYANNFNIQMSLAEFNLLKPVKFGDVTLNINYLKLKENNKKQEEKEYEGVISSEEEFKALTVKEPSFEDSMGPSRWIIYPSGKTFFVLDFIEDRKYDFYFYLNVFKTKEFGKALNEIVNNYLESGNKTDYKSIIKYINESKNKVTEMLDHEEFMHKMHQMYPLQQISSLQTQTIVINVNSSNVIFDADQFKYKSAADMFFELEHTNIEPNSYYSEINTNLIPGTGVITIPKGEIFNYDSDNDGVPDSFKFEVKYRYITNMDKDPHYTDSNLLLSGMGKKDAYLNFENNKIIRFYLKDMDIEYQFAEQKEFKHVLKKTFIENNFLLDKTVSDIKEKYKIALAHDGTYWQILCPKINVIHRFELSYFLNKNIPDHLSLLKSENFGKWIKDEFIRHDFNRALTVKYLQDCIKEQSLDIIKRKEEQKLEHNLLGNDINNTISKAKIRVLHRQVMKRIKSGLVRLCREKGHTSTEIKTVGNFLSSRAGEGLLSALIGFGGQMLPQIQNGPAMLKDFIHECKIEGSSILGDEIIENIYASLFSDKVRIQDVNSRPIIENLEIEPEFVQPSSSSKLV